MTVKGFVIQDAKGSYLAHGKVLYWYEHDRPEEAYVHQDSTIEGIRETSRSWQFKPVTKTPAQFSAETGTVILGPPEPF